MTPAEFPRAFAAAFGAHSATALADLMAPDADLVTLTGQHCEGRAAIEAALAADFAGSCAEARLVTGKTRLRPCGNGVTLLSQRFVLSGLRDAQGRDPGRLSMHLGAVLVEGPEGVRAVQATLSALAP